LLQVGQDVFPNWLEAIMGFEALNFVLPVLFITWSTLMVGTVSVLLGWSKVRGQPKDERAREAPKSLLALTASIFVVLAGFLVFLFLPHWIRNSPQGHSIWFAFVVIGFLLDLAALFLSHNQNPARFTVLTGSLIVAAINVIGLVWLFIATDGSPLSFQRIQSSPPMGHAQIVAFRKEQI